MTSQRISLIVAMAKNGVIGRENKLPWSLPEDLKKFKQITTGHPIIMGRKTFESIGRVLPNRQNIIISRQADYSVPGAVTVSSLQDAILLGKSSEGASEIFIIGGAEIYRLALEQADRIYLTQIQENCDGDAFFPELNPNKFTETGREDHPLSKPPFSFLVLDRKG